MSRFSVVSLQNTFINNGNSKYTKVVNKKIPYILTTVHRKTTKGINAINIHLSTLVNASLVNVPCLYTLKASENQRFSDVFSGYRNESFIGWNGLILFEFLLVMSRINRKKTFNICIHTRAPKCFNQVKADVWETNISICFVYPIPE